MSFVPPRCPRLECPFHLEPEGQFYRLRGYYRVRCRRQPIPRFQCRGCGRSFSRQTFRTDYRDRKPQTNERVLQMLCSGVGLRQIGRTVGLDIHSVQGKLRKYGRQAALLHDNLCTRLPSGRTFVLDEEETFECKSIRRLTVPMLVDNETWFLVATAVGSIRRLAVTGSRRWHDQQLEEAKVGPRPDESRQRVAEVMQALARRVGEGSLILRSDEKALYRVLAREQFGERVRHETTPGTDPRTADNPLFVINETITMSRDNCGRLRRNSWLVSKKADRLRRQLGLFTVYRNYVRRRFNRDKPKESAAKLLGLLPRALTWREASRWRQDWGERSIHPMSVTGRAAVGQPIPCKAPA